MAGAEKSPGGNGQETCVRRLARAIRCANRAGANARGRAQARARDTRAKTVPPLGVAQAGGGADGTERNGTWRRERYAGTEPQNIGGGMGNMTIHDTLQGSFHEPPRLRRGRASAASRAIRCANRAGANARGRAQARTQDTRAKTVPPLEGARAGGARTERSGTERDGGTICRNGTADFQRRHGEHDKT